MITSFSTFARAGVMALALLTGIESASAAPIAPAMPQTPIAAKDNAVAPIQVQNRRQWRRNGGRNWNGNRNWRGGGRHWRGGGRYWRDGNRYWRRGGGYYGGFYGPAIGFGLGFGVPAYGYYDPYYAPRYYAPRRVYRAGNAHVEWCYSRYRSYRASDNTYQPYHGPRRQCYSPY